MTEPDPLEQPTEPMPAGADTIGNERYRLGALLGAGGMGLVRRATDTALDREVAVKLLADNLAADPEARERFIREARAAARVTDPHVVTVHDVGEEHGRPYLIMELIDGSSLADELAQSGPLDPYDVAGVAAQALTGLAAAHAAGLLHRDVKPGNLLRAPGDTIKVADFGVAEAADASGLTRTGFVIGTRSYLAPERQRGAPATVATDLYALGASLVELLTGSPPGDEPATLPADLPHGLRHLLVQLLADRPQDRPASAEAALHALVDPTAVPTGNTPTTRAAAAAAVDAPAEAPVTDTGAAGRQASDAQTSGRRAEATTAPDTHGRDPATPADAARRQSPLARGWRIVLLVGVVLLLIGAFLQLTAGDGTQEGDTPTVDGGTDPTQEPADAARDLARWLRERAEQ